MPVPGPRTQRASLPGYTNPGGERPDRINHWHRPGPVAMPGRTPGLMAVSVRGNVLGAGQIRRLWRQTVNIIAAQSPYSWTHLAPAPGTPEFAPSPGIGITRALRYMTRSVYVAGGTDHSRFEGLHTTIHPRVRSKRVTTPAGAVRGRPTVRNRLTSFGSRVPPINSPVSAAQRGSES
jgi:hypothetical protein